MNEPVNVEKPNILRDDCRYCFFTVDSTFVAHIQPLMCMPGHIMVALPTTKIMKIMYHEKVSRYMVWTRKLNSIDKEPGMEQSMDFKSSVGTWGPGGGI